MFSFDCLIYLQSNHHPSMNNTLQTSAATSSEDHLRVRLSAKHQIKDKEHKRNVR